MHSSDLEAVRYGWTIWDALERRHLLVIVVERVVYGDLIIAVTLKTLVLFVDKVSCLSVNIYATGIL